MRVWVFLKDESNISKMQGSLFLMLLSNKMNYFWGTAFLKKRDVLNEY